MPSPQLKTDINEGINESSVYFCDYLIFIHINPFLNLVQIYLFLPFDFDLIYLDLLIYFDLLFNFDLINLL